MSATGRGRRGGDESDYFTSPSWTVRRLLEAWEPPSSGIWVEPSAGNGAIIRAVDAATTIVRPGSWRAFEIRDEEHEALELLCGVGNVFIGNFLHLDRHPDPSISVVLGNPPYEWAFQFLLKCKLLFPLAEIVFLLRQAFTASQERYAFMRGHMPDKLEVPDRISFDGEGADSADYAWMRWPVQWERRKGEVMLLNQTPLAERKRDRGHAVMIETPQRELFG